MKNFLVVLLCVFLRRTAYLTRLMGPVTATAYGISIGDFKMVRMALFTELVSLCVCLLMGLIIAGCMINFPVAEDWPLLEMTNRASWSNFLCGIPIAFFSGLGVAVGLLDSETNSLVGVAISASLLPPAVNAGMLWVIDANDKTQDSAGGTISLLLTVMNIAVIIVASMFMFRLKEVRFVRLRFSTIPTILAIDYGRFHQVIYPPILPVMVISDIS